jgi:hypothetical protein
MFGVGYGIFAFRSYVGPISADVQSTRSQETVSNLFVSRPYMWNLSESSSSDPPPAPAASASASGDDDFELCGVSPAESSEERDALDSVDREQAAASSTSPPQSSTAAAAVASKLQVDSVSGIGDADNGENDPKDQGINTAAPDISPSLTVPVEPTRKLRKLLSDHEGRALLEFSNRGVAHVRDFPWVAIPGCEWWQSVLHAATSSRRVALEPQKRPIIIHSLCVGLGGEFLIAEVARTCHRL